MFSFPLIIYSNISPCLIGSNFYNQFDDIFWRKRSGLSEKGKAELLTTTEPNKGKNLQKMLLDAWHLLFETVPNKQTNGFEGKGC